MIKRKSNITLKKTSRIINDFLRERAVINANSKLISFLLVIRAAKVKKRECHENCFLNKDVFNVSSSDAKDLYTRVIYICKNCYEIKPNYFNPLFFLYFFCNNN